MNTLSQQKTFKEKFYQDFMPKIYGIGAAVVVAGAMFKLLNWPGGALMLGLGLSTEAIIFTLSAFEPKEKGLQWEKVYPELSENYEDIPQVNQKVKKEKNKNSVSEKLDEIFQNAKLDVNLVKNLGAGMEKLSHTVEKMSNLSEKANVLQQYVKNVEKASHAMNEMEKVFTQTSNAMQLLGNFEKNLQNYTKHMQFSSENAQEMRNFYKKVLEGSKENVENTQKYKTIFEKFVQKMEKTTEESSRFENELNQLNNKVSSINDIYSKMLTAMRK